MLQRAWRYGYQETLSITEVKLMTKAINMQGIIQSKNPLTIHINNEKRAQPSL